MEELLKESCFRIYHFYLAIWDAEVGEQVQVVCLSLIVNTIDMQSM